MSEQPNTTIKECPQCRSKLFSDMGTCYECMYEFPRAVQDSKAEALEDLRMTRLKVVLGDLCAYELLLRQQEGAFVSIGGDADNAVIVSDQDIAAHQCAIFFSEGLLWAEDQSALENAAAFSAMQDQNRIGEEAAFSSPAAAARTILNGAPLNGASPLSQGSELRVGEACITVL